MNKNQLTKKWYKDNLKKENLLFIKRQKKTNKNKIKKIKRDFNRCNHQLQKKQKDNEITKDKTRWLNKGRGLLGT